MSDRCEDCGDRWYDNANLLYDEDGRLICSDCFFEQMSKEEDDEWEDEDDAEDYV